MVICLGAPEGSTGSGSDFKASQKTGPQLKVSVDRLDEAWNPTCDLWFTRHRLSPTPQRLLFSQAEVHMIVMDEQNLSLYMKLTLKNMW